VPKKEENGYLNYPLHLPGTNTTNRAQNLFPWI